MTRMMYGMPNPQRGRAIGPTLQEAARDLQKRIDEGDRARATRAVVAAQFGVAIALCWSGSYSMTLNEQEMLDDWHPSIPRICLDVAALPCACDVVDGGGT